MEVMSSIKLRASLAILPPVVAFMLQWTFWSEIQPFAWFLFYPAVFLSAWIGGLFPGLVSTFISAMAVWWFFIPPQFTFGSKTPMQLVSIGVFIAMGILFSMLLERLKKMIEQAEVANTILGASEENLSVTLNSIGDAVLSTDAEGRVTRLNYMAEQLTGWERKEAIGRPIADIFHIINKKTREPASIPVEVALAQGTIQSLANDTVLIARDGSEFHIADSCAPIRNNKGEVIGAVLVFRDVTKEYAVQEALRSSEERHRMLFEAMDDGFCVIEMLYDADGKANDYRFLEINPAFEKQSGLRDALGKTIRQLVPDQDGSWYEIFGKVARTGESIHFENPSPAIQRHFEVFASRIGGDGSRIVGILFNSLLKFTSISRASSDA